MPDASTGGGGPAQLALTALRVAADAFDEENGSYRLAGDSHELSHDAAVSALHEVAKPVLCSARREGSSLLLDAKPLPVGSIVPHLNLRLLRVGSIRDDSRVAVVVNRKVVAVSSVLDIHRWMSEFQIPGVSMAADLLDSDFARSALADAGQAVREDVVLRIDRLDVVSRRW